jgi:hypothetical protein
MWRKILKINVTFLVPNCVDDGNYVQNINIFFYNGQRTFSLWGGRSGYQTPVGRKIFRTRPAQPWGSPSLL